MPEPTNDLGAGETLLEIHKSDPATQQAWRRIQRLLTHLRTITSAMKLSEPQFDILRLWADQGVLPRASAMFAEAMKVSCSEAAEQRKELEDLREKFRVEQARDEMEWNAEWQALAGQDAPETIEDWESVAVRIGYPIELVRKGHWTPAEVYRHARGYFQRLRDLRQLLPVNRETTPEGPQGESPQDRSIAERKVSWQQVQPKLEKLMRDGQRFGSYRLRSRQMGCSVPTVVKAVRRSVALTHWAEKGRGQRTPRTARLVERHLDSIEQQRERDPAQAAEDAEAEALSVAWSKLMNESTPEERANLNGLTEEERREILRVTLEDPGSRRAFNSKK